MWAAVNYPAYADNEKQTLERQRALFVPAYESAERGEWSFVETLDRDDRKLLEHYLLWPDLRAAYFRATIRRADLGEIEKFLDRHGSLKPARELRYRLALEHVRRGNLRAYLGIYESFYQGLNDATLDCLALRAEIDGGDGARVVVRAKELWLVGKSQVDECDPVFAFLKDSGRLSAEDYRRRYALAIDAREFSLARWLGRSIDDAHVDEARVWLEAQANPEQFLRTRIHTPSAADVREQLAYATERLTYRDPELARTLWSAVSKRYAFTEEQALASERHIALWTARDSLPGAYALLAALPAAAENEEVLRWRARVSLRDQGWTQLLSDIARMSADERAKEEWRYWRAIALAHAGQVNASIAALEILAVERSYYGFLAADELGRDYALADADLAEDHAIKAELERRTDIRRARELFFVGQDGRGRSEWDAATSHLTPGEKIQAALLANDWGWHSRAIATVASVGEYDDLSLRYPLPFRAAFEEHATSARISPTWAYGIARSESLFMRDIRSSAGAVGLMQLMPATGKSVARSIKLQYRGIDTLTDPLANIRLGTAYLGQMIDRFDGNPVLATAAYNAGPHRVDAWMPQGGSVDARVWIENIPFNETRSYVRRVLSADAIFHWRLNGTTRRLSDTLVTVEPPPSNQRVASASR